MWIVICRTGVHIWWGFLLFGAWLEVHNRHGTSELHGVGISQGVEVIIPLCTFEMKFSDVSTILRMFNNFMSRSWNWNELELKLIDWCS